MRFRLHEDQSGVTMFVALMMLLMVGLVGTAMIDMSEVDMAISDNFKRNAQAFYAAESGSELARNMMWWQYVNQSMSSPPKAAGDPGNYSTYAAWLDAVGLPDSSSLLLGAGQTVSQQQRIDSIRIARLDLPAGMGTDLKVMSYGSDAVSSRETVSEYLRITSGMFSGFGFAILAKNINCIMCHARVDNVDRYYNTDLAKLGTFDRTRVASLESLLLRTGSADSRIAGSLYTRGIVTDDKGVPITDLSPSNQGLEAWDMDANGKILEPLTSVKMTNTTGTPLPTYGNLYLDYPSDPAQMTDGELPTTFPAAIPDANSNRQVDQSEFDEIIGSANGSATGGVIYGLSSGSTYGSSSLPGTGNLSSVNGVYDGNLMLIGTDANPVVLNSQIAVNGDVVILGKVTGDGEIVAKGNVYVVGDVTYKDGSDINGRTYGTSQTGASNALSLAAGGNILVGDYLTPKNGGILDPASRDAGDGTSEFSFTMSEITLFNRAEWARTQTLLPGAGGAMVANPEYDPTYKPRYYTLGPSDPVYIYNKNPVSGGKNKGTYYDPATRSWKGKEHVGSYDATLLTQLDPGNPALTGAQLLNLAPSSSWLSEAQLKQFWISDENARVAGTPFQFDGQLYTNNAIFSLTRTASKSGGKMHINGSIVAADVGILTPTELRVNYDGRLQNKLNVSNDTDVRLMRLSWLSQSGKF